MMEEAVALQYLNKNPLLHMSMIFPIKRDTVSIIYSGADGVFLKELESDMYMLSTLCNEKGRELLDSIPSGEMLGLFQREMYDYAMEKYNYKNNITCFQAVYNIETPIKPFLWFGVSIPLSKGVTKACDASFSRGFNKNESLKIDSKNLDIKQLDVSHIDIVRERYSEYADYDYIKSRLEQGAIYGGFQDDELCGFIGTHAEGCIGILEIFPEFRKKGFALELESYMIKLILEKNQIPFAQVTKGNQASIDLHKKLGFDISEDELYFLF
jgi:GNAT superfamily N-acetyltransferase